MPTKSNIAKIETGSPAAEADMSRAATDLAVWQAQASANARAVAQQLHYNGPLDPNVLQQGIVESKARIGAELFAIGARLLLLREQCAHGEFVLRLEALNIDPRAARKYMQVALKFSKTATVAALDGLSLSKLLELAMLDDETLDVLESDGTVLGFKPDELDQMSVREMRVALREAKANGEAMGGLLAAKDNELNKLKGKKVREKISPEELMAHKARPLYELIASAEILSTKLSAAVGQVLNEQDDLLKAEAYNALTLVTQYMLRAADENYMPLDMEALGLDTTDFETKALGLGGLATAEAA